jgi:hypothetical protein
MIRVVFCEISGYWPLLFLDVMCGRLIVGYQCFGMACLSSFQGSSKGAEWFCLFAVVFGFANFEFKYNSLIACLLFVSI